VAWSPYSIYQAYLTWYLRRSEFQLPSRFLYVADGIQLFLSTN